MSQIQTKDQIARLDDEDFLIVTSIAVDVMLQINFLHNGN